MINKMRKLLLVFAAFLFLSGLVIADHLITPVSYSFNDNSSNFYNITVNNTDSASISNITQVNITLPTNISYVSSTNWTNTNSVFSSSGSILTWQNSEGMVMNLSLGYFAFNATGLPGTYNITITTINSTGFLLRNISVTMNDTTAPTLTYNSPAAGANLSQDYVIFNISASDYSGISRFELRVYNTTRDLINTTAAAGSNVYLNLSNLTEGSYYYNITVNDTKNNINVTATRSLILDKTSPGVSISSFVHTETTMNITISISDSGSGIGSSCTSSRGSVSGTGTTQTISETGLECETYYDYNVTCTDRAGNSASDFDTHKTSPCEESDSSGGGGGGDNTASDDGFWRVSYYLTDNSFKNGTTKLLLERYKVMFKVNKTFHSMGVIKLYSSKAKINVSSDNPQQAEIEIGETLKFDVTNDSYYDVSITLNSITNSTKANFTIVEINEIAPPKVTRTPSEAENNISITSLDETAANLGAQSGSLIVRETWFWIVVGAIVVGGVAGTFYFMRKRRMKILGY